MKKKLVFLISALLCALCLLFGFTACDDNTVESYDNLIVSGEIYFDGEQTVSLTFSEYSSNATTFKSGVSANDITVSGVLSGKNIKSLNYIDANTLEITLDGKVTADGAQSGEYGKITVSHNATENGADANAYCTVNFEPKMTRTYNNYSNVTKKYTSEFTLPYGNFIAENVTLEHITVMPADITVNVSVTEAGALRIETVGFEPFEYNGSTYNNPVARIDACVTTFGKELYVNVGDSSLLSEYILV